MYRIVFIAHDPFAGEIVNPDSRDTDVDIEAAQIAHNTVVANRERLADQDYVAYWWDNRIYAVRRVLDAEHAGYHDSDAYFRLVTTKNGVGVAIRDALLDYEGPWLGKRNPVRYGHVNPAGEITFD